MKHVFIIWLIGGLVFLGCDRGPAIETTKTKAEAGDAKAQNDLGRMYFFGAGVEQDNIAAYAWTSLAETNGHPKAKQNKGNIAKKMTPAQIVEAEELFQKLQKQYDVNGTAPSE
jgi:TPR repeat protein